ncbi:MAG: DNA mismatch repair protein MutS, partial [Desulfovibrionaceae bacterium]|nr:DNA mismatch repair protein MutS [Desulfovibrionaceae bacterium]
IPAVHAVLTDQKSAASDGGRQEPGSLPAAVLALLKDWDDLSDQAELLERALVDAPPAQITDGGLFKSGYSKELDELLDLVEHGENRLNALLTKEQETLPKLKIGYNRVFGYYFELSKSAGGTVPEHFIRRQTLANSERFTTAELNELEQKLTSAADKRKSLEYKLFQDLRERCAHERPRLLSTAHRLATLDFWQSLAETAARRRWVRPVMDSSQDIHIIEGRHPVVEAIIGANAFVPNDLHMDAARRMILITGPNMAGKSTVLRQTAIICLLALLGSFVPAREARLGLCDRIFSRVGASDNLAQGQSTFMVEMMETARILRQSTKKSLVILDEIGRGTSTFDGLALAWAVAEDLTQRAGGSIRTLFATHYHELTALEGKLPGVHTMNIAIQERGDDIIFLRRLVPGPSDRSYGIEVARLAGVPRPVVQRAREILANLEQHGTPDAAPKPKRGMLPGLEPPPPPQPVKTQAADHPLLTALRDLKPENLTPLEALNRLVEWKTLWGQPAS